MMGFGCHPACIKLALSNTEARSDCAGAIGLRLRDGITKTVVHSVLWCVASEVLII